MRSSILAIVAGLLALGACAPRQEGAEAPPAEEAPPAAMAAPMEPQAPAATSASATLAAAAGSGITGTVSFQEMAGGVHVEARVEGAPPGTHGFHLHETGDCSAADFASAGGHFNPEGVAHGAPEAEPHHAGDFGNIEIGADGTGSLSLHSTKLAIAAGPNSVVGRAVILHAQADDLATQPTGNAGGRIACGVVAAAAAPGP